MEYKGWNIRYDPTEWYHEYWKFWHENNDGEDWVYSGKATSLEEAKEEIDFRMANYEIE